MRARSDLRSVPDHVAIIMDGNGRWARMRGLPRTEGHTRGADSVRDVVKACRQEGVRFLTLYAFSVANWERPQSEVRALMHLLAHFAEQEKDELRDQGIRLEVVGDLTALPMAPRRALESTMAYTAQGQEMVLSLALSYGGRRDIVGAARRMAELVRAGNLQPEDITEESFEAQLCTSRLPAVDLLIRTSGEARVSDFLLYECAYAELLFVPELWPDFRAEQLRDALRSYALRERRFGLTSAQLADSTKPSADSASQRAAVCAAEVQAPATHPLPMVQAQLSS